MTYSCVPWLIRVCHDSCMCAMTHSCVPWLKHVCHAYHLGPLMMMVCFNYLSWRKNVVAVFGTLSSFLTEIHIFSGVVCIDCPLFRWSKTENIHVNLAWLVWGPTLKSTLAPLPPVCQVYVWANVCIRACVKEDDIGRSRADAGASRYCVFPSTHTTHTRTHACAHTQSGNIMHFHARVSTWNIWRFWNVHTIRNTHAWFMRAICAMTMWQTLVVNDSFT